jgi:hypothetical protein
MHFTGIGHDNVLVKDILQKIGGWHVADLKNIEKSTVVTCWRCSMKPE